MNGNGPKRVNWLWRIVLLVLVLFIAIYLYRTRLRPSAEILLEQRSVTIEDVNAISGDLGSEITSKIESVAVWVDVHNVNANAVEVVLDMPEDTLRFLRFDNSDSDLTKWVINNPAPDSLGVVDIVGGTPTPGFSGKKKVGTVYFYRIKDGNVPIRVLEGSLVVVNDSSATILGVDEYSIIIK